LSHAASSTRAAPLLSSTPTSLARISAPRNSGDALRISLQPSASVLIFCLVPVIALVVRLDDALHQRVPHDVGGAERAASDALDACEQLDRVGEPALGAARQVDLRDVAGDHGLTALTDARQEHSHLRYRGVLRFVEDDEALVQGAA